MMRYDARHSRSACRAASLLTGVASGISNRAATPLQTEGSKLRMASTNRSHSSERERTASVSSHSPRKIRQTLQPPVQLQRQVLQRTETVRRQAPSIRSGGNSATRSATILRISTCSSADSPARLLHAQQARPAA